ncbi:MAG: hypothetical protein KGJ89_02170 [Patescibacteria group bacterium]|nr:hypothetical protein [Patescibacteria group bacterium]MDE2015683.1 hypothetical protein [Patescibacteria group bacterium]MDE2226740.1 hypothetical protein [Patescibacteria group bacterium]
MKKLTIVIIAVVVVVIGAGIYFFLPRPATNTNVTQNPPVTNTPGNTVQTPENTQPQPTQQNPAETVIGKSVEGRDITAYNYGTGDTQILFIGGIHGGYEWNTSLVAYQAMDYLKANANAIPANEKITVIPVLNPDGLNKVVGTAGRFAAADVPASQTLQISGRYNADNVDLNRNFDCDWQKNAVWQNTAVSGGSKAFSEPESAAIRDYITAHKPAAVVVWYSAVGGVFASNCHGGVLPETNTITNIYSKASGYKAYESYDFYALTGDMVNWFAKNNIPGISVLLTTHTDTEWSKNQAGIDALIAHYAK